MLIELSKIEIESILFLWKKEIIYLEKYLGKSHSKDIRFKRTNIGNLENKLKNSLKGYD